MKEGEQKIAKKKTHDEFVDEVYTLVGDEYQVLGEYINNSTQILMRHNECGFEWRIRPLGFIQGNRCYKCSGTMRKTHIQFVKEVKHLVGEEYNVIGEYKNSHRHIEIKHNECGYVWMTSPNTFLSGSRCPKCSGRILETKQEFRSRISNLSGDEYSVLGEYKGSDEKVLMRHNICGYEWNIRPYSFIRGHRCPKCAKNARKTTDEFKREIFKLVGDEYSVMSEYKNTNTKVTMCHNECGYTWEIIPNLFTSPSHRQRCPKCRRFSKGEHYISEYLERINLSYQASFVFDDLIKVKPLRFDFYISSRIMIEFDGGQHFKPIEYFGGVKKYDEIKESDVAKNKYCIDNNIPLIRIPYWEFDNVECILDNILKYFNIINSKCENPSIVEKYYVRDGWDQDEYISQAPCNKKEVVHN